MSHIIFLPFEKKVPSDQDLNLLQLARKLGLPLQSSCGGKGMCGKCRVLVESTEISLEQPSEKEVQLLGKLIKEGYRLACSTILKGGGTVSIPEDSLLRDQVILTSNTEYPYPVLIRPSIQDCYPEVPQPSLNSVKADRERLLSVLKDTYGMGGLLMDTPVLRKLPELLRSGSEGISVAVWNRSEIIDVCEGRRERLLGMAFDVGTTTVVGYLMDLDTGGKLSVKASINPQVVFGDDVISRISYCQNEAGGLKSLRVGVLRCINELVEQAANDAGIESGKILEMTLVGNTVMHHFFMGLNPYYLSLAPYAPVVQGSLDIKARDLGLKIGQSAYVHLLPLKAGFVGSDTVACVLATGIHKRKEPTLLIDLGTNGEIVFGNKERLICCSTAAGPAFEGGHIRWGMRAADGAVERVKIDGTTLDVDVKTIHGRNPLGLCGSGVISAVAEMIKAGIILQRGNFSEGIKNRRMRRGEDGMEFVLVQKSKDNGRMDIVITQKDVAELQMARSAVCTGALILMKEFGVTPDRVKKILLAGAVGNYVEPEDARTIGLLPECGSAEITGVGNAAGYGACLALLNRYKRREAQRIAEKTEYVELAAHPLFRELFVSEMFFKRAKDFSAAF